MSAHIQEFITESVELNATFFEITSVDKISCRLYPSEWSVTAGGVQYVFWIENEDDLMHLHDDVIMIRTNIKKLFIIRFLDQLDKKSRVLLQPFIFLAR